MPLLTIPPPPWLWPLALPLGLLYRLLVGARLGLYGLGLLKPVPAGVPVIAVGNLTTGGAGKTPMVQTLARLAVQAGLRPAIQSRGYGAVTRSGIARVCVDEGGTADAEALGDEPLMLARNNPNLPVYVGARRIESLRLAHVWDRPGVVVVDDAYQHLRMSRDCNVLLVDAERGLGNGRMLPWGPLREPRREFRRADVVIITKANLGDADALHERLVNSWGVTVPVFRSRHHATALTRLCGGERLPSEALAGRPVSLVSGIAQPAGFRALVEALGASVTRHTAHPDHHTYTRGDLEAIEAMLAEGGQPPPLVLTTAKDAVKLEPRLAGPERLWVLELEARLEPPAEAFFFDLFRRIS